MSNFYERVYRVVQRVPPGRVTTYGTVAALLGSPMASRAVGYALRAVAPELSVPWQRVVNREGRIPLRGRDPRDTDMQRALLEAEGVAFRPDDTIDLRRFGWDGEP